MNDEQAIARYRYMLKTAPPETVEQAHAEAFAQLTPEQRRLLLQRMAESVPASERPLVEQAGANPQALARLATRAEIRQPGTAERMFGQAGGTSMGGLMAGSLLSSIAGAVIGSMIAQQFFGGADQSAANPGQADSGPSDADQTTGDGGDFDLDGGFDV
jgi:predicted lipid-binding transport protein (Tim44 family)